MSRSLKEESDMLRVQEEQIFNSMSKQKVIQVLDKKIRVADDEGRKLEKEF